MCLSMIPPPWVTPINLPNSNDPIFRFGDCVDDHRAVPEEGWHDQASSLTG